MPHYYLQHHKSSVDHYDLRLETPEGYMSWALPKGMPTKPGEGRLAVPTPIHNAEYLLEGEIVENYGKGIVQLWDAGEFYYKDEPEPNKLNIFIESTRIEGGYFTLLKTGENWLLLNHGGDFTSDVPLDFSVLSGRTMDEIKNHMPFKPMLSKLVETIPTGEQYVYEEKLDGYRLKAELNLCQAYNTTEYPDIKRACPTSRVNLFSRTDQDWSEKFSVIQQELAALGLEQVQLDGEVVVFNKEGVADFQLLHAGEGEPTYVIFDAPNVPGTLIERRQWLYDHIPTSDHVRVAPYYEAPWNPCTMGQEGLIIKDRNGAYQPDQRGWLKYKCGKEQEFIVLGYTQPTGKRQHIGALLLGYYDNGELKYAGKCGTGFSDQTLEELASTISEVPTTEGPTNVKGATWIQPKLIANIHFNDWSASGKLRHPSFSHLRNNKLPHEVVREVPDVTHPDKLLWPDMGITKQQLVGYYGSDVGDRMLGELQDRPIVLYRCPRGVEQACFFQRNATHEVPGLKIVDVDGNKHYVVQSKQGLKSLANLCVTEVHSTNYKYTAPDTPDRIIFDLDPHESLEFEDVIAAAKDVKDKLDQRGLQSFAKLTGQSGLHVVVPINPEHSFEEVNEFVTTIRNELIEDKPGTYSSRPTRGKIYIDTERNAKGNTTIATWSTRATRDATVSTPITWEDLFAGNIPDHSLFTAFLEKTRHNLSEIFQSLPIMKLF